MTATFDHNTNNLTLKRFRLIGYTDEMKCYLTDHSWRERSFCKTYPRAKSTAWVL